MGESQKTHLGGRNKPKGGRRKVDLGSQKPHVGLQSTILKP